jgi:hypothetical protein
MLGSEEYYHATNLAGAYPVISGGMCTHWLFIAHD